MLSFTHSSPSSPSSAPLYPSSHPSLSLSAYLPLSLCDCRLAHAGLFMGILYNTSSTNMFAKCVRILYGNITVLLAVVVVVPFCARFRSSLACSGWWLVRCVCVTWRGGVGRLGRLSVAQEQLQGHVRWMLTLTPMVSLMERT